MKTVLGPKALVSAVAALVVVPALLLHPSSSAASDTPLVQTSPEDSPRRVSFKQIVELTTGTRVIGFDTNDAAHVALRSKLLEAAALAGERAVSQGIDAARPNEASRKMGQIIRAAIRDVGLDSRAPATLSETPRPGGYPDIEIAGDAPCYLEIKTYNAATEKATDSSFRYRPGKDPRVTRDALHFVLSYQLEKSVHDGVQTFLPIRWKLISLEGLTVDLDMEFSQNNRHLYCEQHPQALIAEAPVH